MNNSLFINKTYSRSELKGLFEAILFVRGKSVPLDELQRIFETSKEDIISLIDELNDDYASRKNGFYIIPVAGGYQLVSNPRYHEELEELFGKRNENVLPKSCLETLAIIAYKQPVSKEDIDRIRGVSSTRSINTLLVLKLITISGNADDIVRSPLYSTTERFLEFFRIKNIDDLPSPGSIEFNKFMENPSMEDETAGNPENTPDSEGPAIPFKGDNFPD
jgi:segregation and condensation protein B